MKYWLRCIIICLCFFVFVTNRPLHLSAETDTPGVDLFILIDQSQSMSGTLTDPPTDPHNLRIDTARYLIDQLGFDALTHSERLNRVSVIGFGTYERSRVMVPLTPVSGETMEQSAEIRETIKQAVLPQQLGFTSMTAAIDLAASELENAAKLGENRPVIVFFITDGSPYDERELSLREYFAEIDESYVRLQELAFDQARMFAIGIDVENRYWPSASNYWDNIAIGSSRVEQADEMKTELAQILANELGYASDALSAGELFVEPYLDTISFSIFRYGEASVEVFYPDIDGVLQPYDFDQAEVRASGDRYDLVVIRNPNPGNWTIQSQQEGERVDIIKQIKFSSVQLEPPLLEIPRYFPKYFHFSLPQGQKFYEQYPLIFELVVTPPGANQGQTLRCCILSEDGQGFRTVDPYVPIFAGQHQISISAAAQLRVDNEVQEILISEDQFSFRSYDAKLSLEPSDLSFSQYEPVSNIQAIFTDEQGRAIIEDPLEELDIIARINLSPKSSQMVPMNRVESGIYRLSQPVTLPGDETKSLEIIGLGQSGEELFSADNAITTFRNVQLLKPVPALPPQAGFSSIAVQLLDEAGRPINDRLARTLDLQARIVPPQGPPLPMGLTYDPDESAFVANVPIPTQFEGQHFVEITAQANVAGLNVEAFSDTLTYMVTTDVPYYRILSPEPAVYPLYEGINKANMPLEIQWIRNDLPINPGDVFVENPVTLITATVHGPDGFVLQNLVLQPMNPNDLSRWRVDLDNLRQEGIYTATFHFNGATLVSQEPYMQFVDTQITFYRVTTGLWRGIISTRNTLITLLFIVVVAGGITESFQRLWPPFPKGILTIREQNPVTGDERQIDTINLFKRRVKRRTVIWKPATPELKALGIDKVIIHPRPSGGNKRVPGIDLEFF
ncbi:MAG: VWA domain-containing protein [Chloroflexi bacterium]|nr:VWA domain-containing protein [Chloroflexota bacterium]